MDQHSSTFYRLAALDGLSSREGCKIARDAVNSCYWPLYEVENGKYRLTYKPKEKLPIIEFLKEQTKFRHLLKPENEWIVEEIQKEIDARWEKLLKMAESE